MPEQNNEFEYVGGEYNQPFDFSGFDSTNPVATNPNQVDTQERNAYRRILDQIAAARSRYNRLGKTAGFTEQQFSEALTPLRGQLDRVDASQNLLSGLTNRLISSSLGSTAGASMAAVNAARLSGDGRYGSGGMAATLAARGAADAAVGQSAALSQAIVQGQLGEANYQQQVLQQRGGIAAALSQLLQQQAGMREERGKLGVAMESQFAEILAGPMQVFGGIREARDSTPSNPSIFGLI